MDDLLEGLLAEENTAAVAQPQPTTAEQPQPTTAAQPQPKTAAAKRERLAIIAAGGRARQYLGKAWSVEEINVLGDDEVRKLHTLYEARLGGFHYKNSGTRGSATVRRCGQSVSTDSSREPAAARG